MMGRTHAATGVLAGLLLGPALGLAEVGPFAATCAGYALLPDLGVWPHLVDLVHQHSAVTAGAVR
jgi:hypothetical protein